MRIRGHDGGKVKQAGVRIRVDSCVFMKVNQRLEQNKRSPQKEPGPMEQRAQDDRDNAHQHTIKKAHIPELLSSPYFPIIHVLDLEQHRPEPVCVPGFVDV